MNDLNTCRRHFLKSGSAGFSAFFLGLRGAAPAGAASATVLYTSLAELGELQAPDENGVRLPAGFRSRIVARSGETVGQSSYVWHAAPDGGACYAMDDGGWVYVSNSEQRFYSGGVGAIRFSRSGEIVDAYRILDRTNQNCAGGATPWQTWLSCEEVDRGMVFECDPAGKEEAVARPALGRFKHEAVAVDPEQGYLYLTEDEPDGRFYRFISQHGLPDLSAGSLEVAEIVSTNGIDTVRWHSLDDPYASNLATREQVSESTEFRGGEGIAWSQGIVYFTTKIDNRVWAYETSSQRIHTLYDVETSPTPILSGVDNVTISAAGDVLVAEDGGDMQIVLLGEGGAVLPVMQVAGHEGSEITGPAFSPDFTRLYFSSQRGAENRSEKGVTYEISRT